MTVRLVHFTDVHFYVPGTDGLLGKRALGLLNLHVVGRAKYFDAGSVVALAYEVPVTQEPEVVRDAALGHGQSTRELSHGQLLVLDKPEDAQASRVREELEQPREGSIGDSHSTNNIPS